MQSSCGRTLFTKAWWAEITKTDEFWKDFEKYVARSTVERRFKSPVGTKHVTIFTEFKTKQRKIKQQVERKTGGAAIQETEEEDDEMDDREDADDPEERKPMLLDETVDTKPSIEVAILKYCASIPKPRSAVKSEPDAGNAVVETPSSARNFLTRIEALPAPNQTPTPAPQFTRGTLSLKRKHDELEIEAEDDTNTSGNPAAIKTEADADANTFQTNATEAKRLQPDTIKTDVEANTIQTNTINPSFAAATSPNPLKPSSSSDEDEVTFLRLHPRIHPIHPSSSLNLTCLPQPPPEKRKMRTPM